MYGFEDTSTFNNSGKPWRGLRTGTNERQEGVCVCVWPLANITTVFPVTSSCRVLKHFSLIADHVTIWIWRLCSLSTYIVWFMLIRINEAIRHECGQLRHMSMVDAPTSFFSGGRSCLVRWTLGLFLKLGHLFPVSLSCSSSVSNCCSHGHSMSHCFLEGEHAVSLSASQVRVGVRRPRGLSA